jgi:hypothetical protein
VTAPNFAAAGQPWKQHLRLVLWSVGLALAAMAALNVVVDPFGAYHWISVRSLRDYRANFESRIARAEILERHRCELAIVGGSRAQIALDPAQPAWGRPACNLGITSAQIAEMHSIVRYLLRRPEVREVVWSVDLLPFDRAAAPHPDFARSRFNSALTSFEYHAGMLFGADALRGSLGVLRDYRQRRRSPFDDLGRTDPGVGLTEHRYRERFIGSLERDALAFGGPVPFEYDASAATQTMELAAQLRQSGREVSLIILPFHVLHFESLAQWGLWDVFERWKRDLVEAAAVAQGGGAALALWDCSGYDLRTAEPVPAASDSVTEMQWHWDSAHVKRSLGDVVIAQIWGAARDRLAGSSEPQLCTRLDRDSLPAVLDQARRAHQRYRTDAAEQLALLDTARERAGLALPPVRTGSR